MSLKTIVVAALALLVAGLVALAVYAHHTGDYLTQDTGLQVGTSHGDISGLRETFAPKKWVLEDTAANPILWYASDTTLRRYVTTAMANWEAAVSELKWQRATSESQADVVFQYKTCRENARGLFIFRDSEGAEWEADTTRDARYWTKLIICINNTSYYNPDDAIVSAIAHEVGHLYGLHEQYIDNVDPPACNDNKVSIMDRLVYGGGEHCDGAIRGPQTRDTNAVYDFYRDGRLSNWRARRLGDTTARIRFKDKAWAERHHVFNHMYSMDGGTQFTVFKTEEVPDNVGSHKNISDVWLARDMSLTQHFTDFAG